MPKLNVKQNNSNVIKAFQVALETGHRNLLDNPWFTVNQRGQSSYTNTSGFSESVDRWKIANKTTLAVVSGGVTLSTKNEISFQQNTEYDLRGETVTASVKGGGVVYSGTTTVPSSGFNHVTLSINGLSVDVRVGYSSGLYFRINVNSSTKSLTLQAVKLELGSFSTLANDAPPDYGMELAKCQRYFFRLKTSNYPCVFAIGRLVAPTQARISIPTPVSMRDNGTITATLNGNILIIDAQQNASAVITSVSALCVMSSGVTILANLSASLGDGHIATMETSSTSAYIDLSADL